MNSKHNATVAEEINHASPIRVITSYYQSVRSLFKQLITVGPTWGSPLDKRNDYRFGNDVSGDVCGPVPLGTRAATSQLTAPNRYR